MMPRDDTSEIQLVHEQQDNSPVSRFPMADGWQGDDGRSHLLSTLGSGRDDLDPNEPCPQKPVYCTGCSMYRWAMAPMSLLVVLLVGLTWYAYVFQTHDASWAELIPFHILLFLLVTSYLQCALLDPGTVPQKWHDAIVASSERSKHRICGKSQMFKPPRSHFDSITQRLVLNMDHFCPWVVNCVGFYNRKFFILFLFWTMMSCLYFIVAMVCRGTVSLQSLILSPDGRTTPLKFMAFIFDCSLCVAVAGFLGFHVKMVLYNQTTIEADALEFDVGWRRNVTSVFGDDPRLWLLPVYGDGPKDIHSTHDGVHWPRRRRASGEEQDAGSELEAGYWSDGDLVASDHPAVST
ncbi:DHHC palmitoyltransferase-domain-containing protein [Baffinella frigidus]|nr:DHHC palmitoyltransferase-domain-containing protein [Cryptophyta sp. CCMP2293]